MGVEEIPRIGKVLSKAAKVAEEAKVISKAEEVVDVINMGGVKYSREILVEQCC